MPRYTKIPEGHFGVAHYFYPSQNGSRLSPNGWPRGRYAFKVFLPGKKIDNCSLRLESIEKPYPLPVDLWTGTVKEIRGYYTECVRNGKSLR